MDRMMMERYSKDQSKVQNRYSRGQNDDGKVQQKAVQSPEEIQQRRNCPRRDTVERVWNEIQESLYNTVLRGAAKNRPF
jgi:hypothetical protein